MKTKFTNDGMTLVAHRWFTGRDSIGIVIIKTEYDGLKSYIGTGQGFSEEENLTHIMNWGTHFPITEAKTLCGYNE